MPASTSSSPPASTTSALTHKKSLQKQPLTIRHTVGFLREHAPFSQIEEAALIALARAAKLSYHTKGTQLFSANSGDPATFYIVQKGEVRSARPGADDVTHDYAVALHAGEAFPLGALIEGRAPVNDYWAFGDSFCYEFPRAAFQALYDDSAVFRDFCSRRIAHLLQDSRRQTLELAAAQAAQAQSMSSLLSTLTRRKPVTCSPTTPVREALERMHERKIGSIVLIDDNELPVGIFTERDLIARVILPQVDLASPIADIASCPPITLPGNATAFDAAMTMARHSIRHIVITEGEPTKARATGLISERDLFSLTRVGLRQVSAAIRHARSLSRLKSAASDLKLLTRNMMAQGVAVEQLTQFVATLNDSITERALELTMKDAALYGISFVWLAFGSEGRMEQTFSTDQDNGILFTAPVGMSATEARGILLPLARHMNEALDSLGFPLCRGNIMASNPELCLTQAEWQDRFDQWIHTPTPEALLAASIYFDFRPLAHSVGATFEGASDLRAWLAGVAKRKSFLRAMAENALATLPPATATWFGQDKFELEDGKLDLKLYGTRPFVDAARLLSLAQGVTATQTSERLKTALPKQDDPAAMIEAFHFIQGLRLKHQLDPSDPTSSEHALEQANRINPNSLNTLDRRILKESFRQARKLQSRLEMDYQI